MPLSSCLLTVSDQLNPLCKWIILIILTLFNDLNVSFCM